MTQLDLFEYRTLEEVAEGMEELREADPEIFDQFTLDEIISDAVTAGLMSVDLGKKYLEMFSAKS